MNWIARLFDLFSFRFAPASAAVERRADVDQAIRLLQDYIASKGGVAETIKRFEKAGFTGKVRSWRADGANLPINSVEALQLIGWKDLRDMSAKSGLSIDRLRDILADQLPGAIRRACAA